VTQKYKNGRSNEYATRSDFCRIYVNVISVSAPGFRIIQIVPIGEPRMCTGNRITEAFLWRHPK
jgi:hypothetical protein